ncbi:copper transporter MctB [soil metagenome]
MISFRFHVISIVAVFLALALGVVVGSTYVDRAIVDSLRNRIDTVSTNLDDRRAENDQLSGEVNRLDDYVSESASFAVTDRLLDTSVVVVAERGTDADDVEDLVLLVNEAGADAPGILWLEPEWAFDDTGDRDAVSEALEARASSPGGLRDQLWRAVVRELSAEQIDGDGDGGEEPEAPEDTTTTVLPGEEPSPDGELPAGPTTTEPPPEIEPASAGTLETLIELGIMSYQAIGDGDRTVLDLAGTGPRALYLTSVPSEVAVEGLAGTLAAIGATEDVPTVVATISPDDDDPDLLEDEDPVTAAIREDDEQAAVIPTVDHARLEQGKVAAVLALSDVGSGLVGHYGYAPGADRVVPEWSRP